MLDLVLEKHKKSMWVTNNCPKFGAEWGVQGHAYVHLSGFLDFLFLV